MTIIYKIEFYNEGKFGEDHQPARTDLYTREKSKAIELAQRWLNNGGESSVSEVNGVIIVMEPVNWAMRSFRKSAYIIPVELQ